MKIKLIEPLVVGREYIDKLASSLEAMGHEFVYYDTKTTDIDEMKARVEDAEILMIANNPLPNEVIEVAKELKMISVAFTGFDHVGRLAWERGITVCNAAGYANDATAELALGLTLNLMRNISQGNEVIRKGGTIAGLIGNELKGKTIGIVGAGRIGAKAARIFRAFETNVIAYDPTKNSELEAIGVEYLDIDEVMSKSDVISLHLPLNDATRGFISREKLERMKETAVLINCARGPVVDNDALAELLNEDKIAGAGLDVFDMEPPIPSDYPILTAKNTLLTPHVAFASDESMEKRADITFDNVVKYLEGNPINIVKG